MSGRNGFNSLINGLWIQKGVPAYPYFTRNNLFLYCDGLRWRISQELGGSEDVFAFADSASLSCPTPDKTSVWNLWNGESFAIDPKVCLVRSYGVYQYESELVKEETETRFMKNNFVIKSVGGGEIKRDLQSIEITSPQNTFFRK